MAGIIRTLEDVAKTFNTFTTAINDRVKSSEMKPTNNVLTLSNGWVQAFSTTYLTERYNGQAVVINGSIKNPSATLQPIIFSAGSLVNTPIHNTITVLSVSSSNNLFELKLSGGNLTIRKVDSSTALVPGEVIPVHITYLRV